jgi:hypothetical protein
VNLQLAHPALLAGLALVLLPILAHFTGSRKLETVEFPAVRFLDAAHRTLRRRWLLDDLLLLAVRALAVAALVLLFCRPSVLRPVEAVHGSRLDRDTVLVIDRSLSTRSVVDQETVFERIRAEGLALLADLEPGARAGLIWMDQRAVVVGPGLAADRAELAARLQRLEPGYGSTDLAGAIRLATEILATAGSTAGQVVVLGDGTASHLGDVDEIPDGIELIYRDLAGPPSPNRFVADVRVGDGDPNLPLDVVVGATAGAPDDRFALDLELEDHQPLHGTAAVGEVKRFTVVAPRPGTVPGLVSLAGDALPADDTLAFFLQTQGAPSVSLLGSESGASPLDDELYYLTRALETGARPMAIGVEDLPALPAGRGTVLVLANVPCTAAIAEEVTRLVHGGAGVLMSAGDLVQRESCNEHLGALLPAHLGSVKSREAVAFEQAPIGLAMPDVDQDLWGPFRHGGLPTFGRVRFDRVMEVEPHLASRARVLLRYTDGRAAVLERQVGEGTLLLFTSTLDDDWTDLPIRAIYLPMIHQLVAHLAGAGDAMPATVHRVGERPRVGPLPATGLRLSHPDGVEEPLDGGAEVQLPVLAAPGHYRILHTDEGGAVDVVGRLAVRTDPLESALDPVDREALVKTGLIYVEEGRGSEGRRATVMRPVSLVPALAACVLLALIGEAALGRRR